MHHVIHNNHWLRYPLWLWALFSLVVWLLLPAELMRVIAPWACGALLVAAAYALGCVWLAMDWLPAKVRLKAEMRAVLFAVVATSLCGIGCWLVFALGLMPLPSHQVASVAWILCSAGFVLSLTVARLMLAFIIETQLLTPANTPRTLRHLRGANRQRVRNDNEFSRI